jgi:hypothetical protein
MIAAAAQKCDQPGDLRFTLRARHVRFSIRAPFGFSAALVTLFGERLANQRPSAV